MLYQLLKIPVERRISGVTAKQIRGSGANGKEKKKHAKKQRHDQRKQKQDKRIKREDISMRPTKLKEKERQATELGERLE